MVKLPHIRVANIAASVIAFSISLLGQTIDAPQARPGTIVGTVTDANGDPVPNSTVVLKKTAGSDNDRQSVVTLQTGYFEFHNVKPWIEYDVKVSAKDFSDWNSPAITLEPNQFKILTGIQMRIRTEVSQVQVKYDPIEVATEQLKSEEQQRVFGFIPNFYITYDQDAAPLTAKMKFQLALKVSVDPVTAAGVALVSASKQAANSPKFGQGWGPYGERVGATAADGFSDIMIGGAILPSLLHQDPRYFYQGTGTTGSRIRHAIFSPFVARSDSGKWEPNYSSLGGDLASGVLANLYYPQSNRGAGLVFGNFAIGTAERMGANIAQELFIGKFTKRGGHMK